MSQRPEARMSTSERTFEEWRTFFAAHGPRVGAPMPEIEVVDMDGEPASLSALWHNRPAVLVTASLTCPVARRRIPPLAEALAPYREALGRGVLYTREAHPVVDKAPHADGEWLTDANKEAGILHRQPTTIVDRLRLAELMRAQWTTGFAHFVDTMDDTFYDLFGTAPCMGLLIDSTGTVQLHQGWLEPDEMRDGVDAILKNL